MPGSELQFKKETENMASSNFDNADAKPEFDLGDARTAITGISLNYVMLGDFLVIVNSKPDVIISEEPYLSQMILVEVKSGMYIRRIWNRTVERGEAVTIDQLVDICNHHFFQGNPCIGCPQYKTEEEGQDFVISQTPIPRKISKYCQQVLGSDASNKPYACPECLKLSEGSEQTKFDVVTKCEVKIKSETEDWTDKKMFENNLTNSANDKSIAENTSQACKAFPPSDIDDKGWHEGFLPNTTISEVNRRSCQRGRPRGKSRKLTYGNLIAEAINNSAKKMLPLSRIYAYITKHSYLEVEEKTWQNTIRRNLSVNPKFEKVPRKMGRGCLWVIKGGQHDIKDIEKEEESLIIENEEGVMDARCLVDVNKMKCLLCEKGFAYKNSLIKHAKAVHGKLAVPETVASEVSGNKMLQCNFCDESFTVVGHWAKHMQQHSADFGLGPGQGSRPGTSRVGAKPKCSRMDTINTEEGVPKNRTKAKCHYCGEGFESRKLLLSHKLSSHKDNMRTSFLAFYLDKTSVPCGVALDGDGAGETARVLDCECCDNQTFINVGGWVRHMQHHKGEPGVHIPEVQEYHDLLKDYNRTVKREWAQRHKRKHKRKEGKFICHLCGAVMVRSAQYYHLQSVHKIGATDYTCEVCGKVDQCKYKHQQHVRTHSNEKRFVCPHCGKAYKSKHGLAICGRRCTGVGVFECSTCSKTFTAKARLKFHEMLHQGIRPHECPLCHLTYTRRTNMTDHFKRVHKKRLSDVVAELQMQTDKKEERELIKDALLQEN